jgi:hypothetical protein
MTAPLLLDSPADILQKACHDFDVLRESVTAYSVFNFFVTCYHIRDYIHSSSAAPKAAVAALFADADFQLVRFLCNREKHMELRPSSARDHYELLMGARSGIARSGAVRSGEKIRWHIYVDGRRVETVALGERVLAKWKMFFDEHGIPR